MGNCDLGINFKGTNMLALRLCTIFAVATCVAAFSTTRCNRDVSRSHSCLFSDADGSGHEFDDFAEFSSTQLASDNGDADPFLASLQSRMEQVQQTSHELPLMILDTMLPRQILHIQVQHDTLKSLMRHRIGQETPTLAMLGAARLSTGQTVPLKNGVEVQIIGMEKAAEAPPTDTVASSEEPWDISLRAGRRLVVEGEAVQHEGGWTEARVRFLDSQTEEEGEVRDLSAAGGDRMSVARAIAKSRQFTEPNMTMEGGASLVDRWIELARANERHPGQIDTLLGQLGDIPPAHAPSERAMWVGALINPLPSMGVAKEIRPALLVSKRAEERVQVALDGIVQSIKHMDGSERLW